MERGFLKRIRWTIFAAGVLVVMLGAYPNSAFAQLGAAPSNIVIDEGTGAVLSADHPDELRFPASLTKLMTLYLTFKALQDHQITLNQLVPVSAHAASMEPVKLWLTPRTRITVQQCILGMITLSANDAAAAMGEFLGGTEPRFARMMTRQARALGMTRTVFRNASGLPNPDQVTTARDIAILARALIRKFPGDYHYFNVRSFVFLGHTVFGHDPLLGRYPGADGMKTGYTSAAGFNMVTSAVHNGKRLIGVVLGAPSDPVRDIKMVALLNSGFGTANPIIQDDTGVRPTLISTASAAEAPASVQPSIKEPRSEPPVGYAVQVGSFSSWSSALHAVRRTVATVGGVAHVRRFTHRGKPVWQARVISLTRSDAERTCPDRLRKSGKCFIIAPPEGRERVAGR